MKPSRDATVNALEAHQEIFERLRREYHRHGDHAGQRAMEFALEQIRHVQSAEAKINAAPQASDRTLERSREETPREKVASTGSQAAANRPTDRGEPLTPVGAAPSLPSTGGDSTALVTSMHHLCNLIDKFPDFDDLGIEEVKVKSVLLRDIEAKAAVVMNGLLTDWQSRRSATARSDDDPLVIACRGLIRYWTRNLLNFQHEKADDHVKAINRALPATDRCEKPK